MEHMKFEIILGAGQEGLITSDFDGELNWRDQKSKIELK